MPSVRIRFLNGETGEWQLHERAKVDSIHDLIRDALPKGSVGFGIVSEEGVVPADYGRLFLKLAEVTAVEIHGLVDEQALLGPWAESEGHE